ncbi:hypothetical protein DH2020_039581 [Rehmannia glutinosa]|uniref:Auxin response factor n=1 Tax=Rehmannia glutinosa TaxID=99300 RepID=A0ABR0UW58_REHGL
MTITLVESKEKTEETEKCMDSQFWHACAGNMVQMPPVNSKVFYVLQGHLEQCSENVDLGSYPSFPPHIPCTVSSIKFMANPETDEVFAKIRLVPGDENSIDFYNNDEGPIEVNRNQDKPPVFTKTLTQSDAIGLGGVSVNRYCADMIFPKLNQAADPPAQNIHLKDVHGKVWEFRYIFGVGWRRRHLLTTGWEDFVKKKELTAEDSVVFMRAENGDLCVGIRRANSSKGQVKVEDVIEAARLAVNGKPFEVVYWPRAGTPEFCVRASIVRAAMGIPWSTGMRFKMAFETEDWMRTSWFMGNVVSVEDFDPVHWPDSLWRCLRVRWDKPDLLQNMNRISPWQVELVQPDKPTIHPPPSWPTRCRPKKRRLPPPQHPEVDRKVTLPAFPNNPFLSSFNNLIGRLSNNALAGMQGAWHDAHQGLSLPDLPNFSNIQSNLFPLVDFLGFDGSSQPTAPSNLIISKPGSDINTEQQISSTSRSSDCNADGVGNILDASSSDLNRNDGTERSLCEGFQTECKVFVQLVVAGRTMDLSLVGSYEELYEKLRSLFGINISDIRNRVVYRDTAGAVRQLGDEPFSDFVKSGRRLTILPD